MISSMLLLANVLFFMLRISPSAGSFPKPLSAQEEREALERMAQGDPLARSKLIEHNLRLVAHVVKKDESKRNAPRGLWRRPTVRRVLKRRSEAPAAWCCPV